MATIQDKIKALAPLIPNTLTRKYFNEVVNCCDSRSYRSSVTILWSVVICDLFFKLQGLAEHYKDKKAEKILEGLAKSHEGDNFPPAWEIKFVESIKEKTELLDDNQYNKLIYLHKTRNLAVHPKIKQHLELFDLNKLELFNPTENEACSLIYEILEGLLIKKPIHSKEVFNALVEDLEEHSEVSTDNGLLKTHLHETYYDCFNTEVKKFVFKGLWHNLFEVTNERCENIRDITYYAFLLLFDADPSTFVTQITENKTYFSRIAKKGSPVIYLIRFLARQPNIYKLLNSRAKLVIETTIQSNSLARLLAHFAAKDTHEHTKELSQWICEKNPDIEDAEWDEFKDTLHSLGLIKTVICLANIYYGSSENCNTANKRFRVVKTLLKEYDESNLIDLIQKIEKNDKTWNRKRARTDHQQIVSRMKKINPSFDFKQFKAFAKLTDKVS